jgi:hypothetical protein
MQAVFGLRQKFQGFQDRPTRRCSAEIAVADNGKTFEQMRTYEEIRSKVETVVSLPTFTDELFPQDIASMLKSRLTFKEVIESPDE